MSTNAIRVLVVDDSSTVRRVVSDALNSDSDITVIGTAANGRIGLTEIARLEPDLVTLDIEMPDMDGLTMLTELRRMNPKVPVIMVSTLTGRGAAATLDALARGASDYVTKPTSATATSATSAIEHFRRELVPKVKALCTRRSISSEVRRPLVTRPRPAALAAPASGGVLHRSPAARVARYELLAIGSSTGGPNALEAVLTGLPAEFPAPILITQHMPPTFTKMLADRLDQKCALHVVEAAAGMRVENGVVYIAPGDYHLVLKRSEAGMVLATNQNPPENSCRPAVDVMFRSIADTVGSRTLAIVLTGMGYDGRAGAGLIAQAGGEIIAQDEASSVVWGMPGAVAEAGLASEILPLDEMVSAIVRRFGRRPGVVSATAHAPAPAAQLAPAASLPTPLARPLADRAARPAVAPARPAVAPARPAMAPTRTVAPSQRPSIAAAAAVRPSVSRPPVVPSSRSMAPTTAAPAPSRSTPRTQPASSSAIAPTRNPTGGPA